MYGANAYAWPMLGQASLMGEVVEIPPILAVADVRVVMRADDCVVRIPLDPVPVMTFDDVVVTIP